MLRSIFSLVIFDLVFQSTFAHVSAQEKKTPVRVSVGFGSLIGGDFIDIPKNDYDAEIDLYWSISTTYFSPFTDYISIFFDLGYSTYSGRLPEPNVGIKGNLISLATGSKFSLKILNDLSADLGLGIGYKIMQVKVSADEDLKPQVDPKTEVEENSLAFIILPNLLYSFNDDFQLGLEWRMLLGDATSLMLIANFRL